MVTPDQPLLRYDSEARRVFHDWQFSRQEATTHEHIRGTRRHGKLSQVG